MSTIRAVVVDPAAQGRLGFADVTPPRPLADEAEIAVVATSLNPGEVQVAAELAPVGWRPGRDFAGVVVQQAADGSGPHEGARVFGMRDEPGVWAERIAVPTGSIAELPDAVSFADAAALPVAGLTALHALRRGGMLLGRRVLITGSTGAVGLIAHRLARLSGATVVGLVRSKADVTRIAEAGADHVVVGDPRGVTAHGPYDLAVESLGGAAFTAAASALAPDGLLVNIGWSAGERAELDVMAFNRAGGARMYGLRLDTELRGRPKTADLTVLADLLANGQLNASVEIERPWTDIAEVAEDLRARRYKGKAVLHVVAEPPRPA